MDLEKRLEIQRLCDYYSYIGILCALHEISYFVDTKLQER